MDKVVIGIDPGVDGSIVSVDAFSGKIVNNIKMPVLVERIKKYRCNRGANAGKMMESPVRGYDAETIISIFRHDHLYEDVIILERSMVMPAQDVMSGAKVMYHFGLLVGILKTIGRQVIIISPQTWKKYFGLIQKHHPGEKRNVIEMKKKSVIKAQELSGCDFIPEGKRSPDHNAAEAYLMAIYLKDNMSKYG